MQFLINIHSLLPDESERARGARSLQAVSRVKSANERPFRERKRERRGAKRMLSIPCTFYATHSSFSRPHSPSAAQHSSVSFREGG